MSAEREVPSVENPERRRQPWAAFVLALLAYTAHGCLKPWKVLRAVVGSAKREMKRTDLDLTSARRYQTSSSTRCLLPSRKRKWRNWQTRRIQDPVG